MERIETLLMQGVTRRFGGATALHEFTLEIAGGTFTTLLGPSGCGKTTALNCLAGLLDLSAGEILLNNKPIHRVPPERRGFGMVFQNYALFPHLNVARNVGYGLTLKRVPGTLSLPGPFKGLAHALRLDLKRIPRAERQRSVQRALEMVHLEEFTKRYPSQLSGGQQQRLAIARTIVLEPSLLLLDEPLSNLDANLRNEMRIEIKRIHTELGLTTLYVTHDQAEAMSLSDVVVVMRQGRIEQVGAPQEIYNRPHSLYVAKFMGYSNRLSATIVGREGDFWLAETDDGICLHASATTGEGVAWQHGKQVVLCFKPDDTLADPLPPSNQMQGSVQLVEYVGKAFEALVRLDGENGAQLLVQSQHLPETGARIAFGVRPERLLVFASDEQDAPGSLPSKTGDPVPTAKAMR